MIPIIPLYILGLLQRFGPQHGYQIRKIIAEQLSDFTQIKLPTIYYHLEKMRTAGLLTSSSEKPDSRPEKTVYTVTEKGLGAFGSLLGELLVCDYKPTFPSDAVFYFSDYLKKEEVADRLRGYIEKLNKINLRILHHKNETLRFLPDNMKGAARIIFSHHERHYRAELDWASETLAALKEEDIKWQSKE